MTTRSRHQLGKGLAVAAGLLGAVAAFGPANAGSFPERDITFIVPYSPGGGSDQQARRLQEGLEKNLGVKLRLVYKTGGGGAVGFLALHDSKADGYTISNVVVPNIIVTAKGDDVGYKPDKFAYISMTEKAQGGLAVPMDSKFKTLQDLVDYAKKNPGKLTVAGVGATGEANFAEIKNSLGVEATYVPVSGGVGKIMPMLQGNHVDAAVLASNHGTRHKATVRTLGVAGTTRSAGMPDVPTFDELGFKGYTMQTTWGVMAPPGTPADVVATLNAALRKTLADPTVKNAQVGNGLSPMSQSPDEAKAYVAAEAERVKQREAALKK